MGIKIYKPTSAGRRNSSVSDFAELTTDRREKSLCIRIKKSGGRNHSGMTMVRFRGGGARQIYRLIDFKRNKDGVSANVASVEYDPNRNCYISLLHYADGEKRYILAPEGIKMGDKVESGMVCEPKVGNSMPLEAIPSGLEVHNIEMTAGQGGKLVRVAGGAARIIAKEGDWVTLQLPSGEMRMVRKECRATIGKLSNTDYQNIRWGKAGRTRHKGRRGHVRGKAQNPVAHPMGGGEGRSNGGRHPCSPTGVLAKGGKTRCPRKVSSKRIIRRRRSSAHGQVEI
jgi:large subunit ribosomal protein L2